MHVTHQSHHQGAIWSLIYWVEDHLHFKKHASRHAASHHIRKAHNEFLDDVSFFKDDEEFDAYMQDLG